MPQYGDNSFDPYVVTVTPHAGRVLKDILLDPEIGLDFKVICMQRLRAFLLYAMDLGFFCPDLHAENMLFSMEDQEWKIVAVEVEKCKYPHFLTPDPQRTQLQQNQMYFYEIQLVFFEAMEVVYETPGFFQQWHPGQSEDQVKFEFWASVFFQLAFHSTRRTKQGPSPTQNHARNHGRFKRDHVNNRSTWRIGIRKRFDHVPIRGRAI